MGTSSGYLPPTGGDWHSIKTHLSDLSKDTTNNTKARVIISKFIKAIGGATAFAAEERPIGKETNRTHFSSYSARKILNNILSFMSDSSKFGLQQALESRGLSDLQHESLKQIKRRLIEFFSEPAIDGDTEAASRAAAKIFEEIFEEVESKDELESFFTEIISSHESKRLLCLFYEYYICQLFDRTFFEDSMNKFGLKKTIELTEVIHKTIKEEMQKCQYERDLSTIDFSSTDGQLFVQGILQSILEILENDHE